MHAKSSRRSKSSHKKNNFLLTEECGSLEADDNEQTYQITQKEIVDSLDISSATKHFDLKLDFGPYHLNYFRNGKNLILGGRRGHVAVMDWLTKDLMCEFNVQESIDAVQWLHMPTMFAVAQKDWVHIYDDKGTELHCLKKLFRVKRLEFLPYHFLLVAGSDTGFLSWLDVSVGQIVASFKMKQRKLISLKQNPYNGVVATTHPNGTVSMWSPNQQESLVSMLCHGSAVRDICFENSGNYMATIGVDRGMRVWDIRKFKCLQNYKLRGIPGHLNMSQNNLLSVSMGNVVEVYKNFCDQTVDAPYMRHRLQSTVASVQFCNYEDVLGVGHEKGFTSLIIPGAGEPNFDAFESNPFMTKSQRREMEVKSLLEKIQPELITLDPRELIKVDTVNLQKKLDEKKKIKYVKPKEIQFEYKKKNRQKTAKKIKIKKGLREEMKKQEIKEKMQDKQTNQKKKIDRKKHVLERFKTKV